MPIHIIPTRISTASKTFKQYHTNKSNICGISDDKIDCSHKVPSAIAQTMRIYHSDAYAKELKLETVLTKMSKFTI